MLCLAASSCSPGGTPSGNSTPPPLAASQPVGSALIRAIEDDDTPAAMTLIHAGQGLNDRIGTRRTPVTAAIEAGNVDVLKALIAADAPFDPTASAGEYVGLAAAGGRWPMFDFVRSVCPTLTGRSTGDRTALQCLAFGNRTQTQPDGDRIAVALIEAGVDPHFCGEGMRAYPKFAALPMAAMHPYRASLVRTLLGRIQFAPAELDLALEAAARSGAIDSIVMIQQARAEQKMPPPSPQVLCDAAGRYDTVAAVEVLIASGANVNATQKRFARTPLHTAITRGDAAIVSLLLDRNADPAVLDAEGQSCLDLAETRARHGREKAMDDSPSPHYELERSDHTDAGRAIQAALLDWLNEHPEARARVDAALRARPTIDSLPAATPLDAFNAYASACGSQNVTAARARVLLPDDRDRRLEILRRVDIAVTYRRPLDPPRVLGVIDRGTVAVATVLAHGVIASTRYQKVFEVRVTVALAKRNGRWLVVIDSSEGGGLTEAERTAIEPLMRKDQNT